MQEEMLLQKKPSGLRPCIYYIIITSLRDSQYPSPGTESFANILKRFNAECTNDGKISCNGRNWSPS